MYILPMDFAKHVTVKKIFFHLSLSFVLRSYEYFSSA